MAVGGGRSCQSGIARRARGSYWRLTRTKRLRLRIEEALALLEDQNDSIDLAEARISFARILSRQGQDVEARRLLEQVRASAHGTEARMLIMVADDMMATLGEGPAAL
ncbi:MAG: hypothetical protein ACRDHU_00920 [Actinomycetota bacterium]